VWHIEVRYVYLCVLYGRKIAFRGWCNFSPICVNNPLLRLSMRRSVSMILAQWDVNPAAIVIITVSDSVISRPYYTVRGWRASILCSSRSTFESGAPASNTGGETCEGNIVLTPFRGLLKIELDRLIIGLSCGRASSNFPCSW